MRLFSYKEYSCPCNPAPWIYPHLFQAGTREPSGKLSGNSQGWAILADRQLDTREQCILSNVNGQSTVISVREMWEKKEKRKEKKQYENLGLLTRHIVCVLCQGVLFASFTGTNKITPISPKERWQLATQARDGFWSASHKINKIVKGVLAQQLSSFFFFSFALTAPTMW